MSPSDTRDFEELMSGVVHKAPSLKAMTSTRCANLHDSAYGLQSAQEGWMETFCTATSRGLVALVGADELSAPATLC